MAEMVKIEADKALVKRVLWKASLLLLGVAVAGLAAGYAIATGGPVWAIVLFFIAMSGLGWELLNAIHDGAIAMSLVMEVMWQLGEAEMLLMMEEDDGTE